jgi:uncharacterized damage-inducible protein DinB
MIVALIAATQPQPAATTSNPVADATRAWLQQEARDLIAAAEEMPADKYMFQATPAQMTFAHLMTHVVESNRYMCSSIAGEGLPKSSDVKDSDGKDAIVADVKASFDYCNKVLSTVDDSKLADQIPLFKRTRANLMIFVAADHADHYATAAMYLRLNGLVPPTAQPKK